MIEKVRQIFKWGDLKLVDAHLIPHQTLKLRKLDKSVENILTKILNKILEVCGGHNAMK